MGLKIDKLYKTPYLIFKNKMPVILIMVPVKYL